VKAKNALILGLAIVLVVSVMAVVGCGGSDKEAKEALRTALAKIETQVTDLTKTFTSGGTVADLKAAKDRIAPDWEAVVTAAEGVKGADVEAAKKAWTDAEAAIDAVPDSATLMEAAASIMAPVQNLLTAAGDLGALVEEK
jgi:nitroreductase